MFPEDESNVISSEDLVHVNASNRTPLKLSLSSAPTAISMGVFDNKLMLDLTAEEEALTASLVTIVLAPGAESSSVEICQFEKPGGAPLSRERLTECTTLAKKQAKTVRKMMEKAVQFDKMP